MWIVYKAEVETDNNGERIKIGTLTQKRFHGQYCFVLELTKPRKITKRFDAFWLVDEYVIKKHIIIHP